MTDAATLRLLTEADAAAMNELFSVAFGSAMPPALWHWKYGEGRGLAMGLWQADGHLTAHYGAMPRPVLDAGKPCLAVQIGDVMVRQQDRSSLSRKGPFFEVASTFLDRYIGHGRPYLHGFGFPNRRAMQVAQRLGLYQPTGEVIELHWLTAQVAPLPWSQQAERLQQLQPHSRELAQLWQAMHTALPNDILGLRDAARLQQRYLNHPTVDYQLWLLRHRLSRQAIGLVVLRRHASSMELLDLVAAPQDWDACAQAAAQIARQQDAPLLTMWLSQAHARYFQSRPKQIDIDVLIPCNAWSPGPSPDAVANRWLLTAGDTDFR